MSAEGTPQVPDTIEYEGHVFSLWRRVSPLQEYLTKHPNKTPKEFAIPWHALWRSDLWRGHIARYRIAGGKLWLVNIEVPIHGDEYDHTKDRMVNLTRFYAPFPIQRIFGNAEPAVHAQWFTGDLRLTRSSVNPELIPNGTLSTKDYVLTFENGVLLDPTRAEQDGADKPATARDTNPDCKAKSKAESEVRPQ